VSNAPEIVAIGLLTQRELELLGQGFDRAFPINGELVFEELLRAIDEAEQAQEVGTKSRLARPPGA
jgi:hypothetical protein